MKYIQSLFFAFLAISSWQLSAQTSEIYAVQLGQFINAKSSSFSEVKDLGYVYAVNVTGNVKDVFIGGLKGKSTADQAVAIAKKRGYIDATAINLSAQNAEVTTVIQLGVRDARQTVDWQKFASAGRLFALLNGDQLKIMAGPYPNTKAAKAILPTIQRRGFSDAFVKNVSSALIHEVTDFETGIFGFGNNTPPPLPPAASTKMSVKGADQAKSDSFSPTSYEVEDAVVIPIEKKEEKRSFTPSASVPLIAKKPIIRSSVKRSSVLELQKILKSEGAYSNSLDGYYGAGTKSAYETAWSQNRQLRKYRALAQYNNQNASTATAGSLQYALNGIWDDPKNALLTLERSNSAVAKAYRAYWLYENSDDAKEIDNLMNAAIKQAFQGKNLKNAPKFDYSANYSYRNFDQLLLHLSYVQSVSQENLSVPCWVFERYQAKALQIFGTAADAGNIELQDCGGFVDWQEMQILNTIANDISAGSQIDEAKEAEYRAKAIRLFLAPVAPSSARVKSLEDWQKALLTNMNGWASKDPTLKEMATAFGLTFYQSYILLEDYFATKGYNSADAKALSLDVLQAVLGTKVDRFV